VWSTVALFPGYGYLHGQKILNAARPATLDMPVEKSAFLETKDIMFWKQVA
jgi:hypothetical protein